MNAAADSNADSSRGLNFWQWLGLIVIVIGLIFYFWPGSGEEEPAPTPDSAAPPATQPVE